MHGIRQRQRLVALSDLELVDLYRKTGEQSAFNELWGRHEARVLRECRRLFLPGSTNDDRTQIAMFGFTKAVRDYDPEQRVTFASFAVRCAHRQVVSAVRTATAQKSRHLNESARLEQTNERGELIGDVIPGAMTVERQFESRSDFETMAATVGITVPADEFEELIRQVGDVPLTQLAQRILGDTSHKPNQTATEQEMAVLLGSIAHVPYSTVAKELGQGTKWVDNTLQRIRGKIRRALPINDDSDD